MSLTMDKIKCEIKLSKKYNSFGYSVEGTPDEADGLRYFVLLKTLMFMKDYDEMGAMRDKERIEYVRSKLEEMKFGWCTDENGEFKPTAQAF